MRHAPGQLKMTIQACIEKLKELIPNKYDLTGDYDWLDLMEIDSLIERTEATETEQQLLEMISSHCVITDRLLNLFVAHDDES